MSFTLADSHTNICKRNSPHGELETQFQSSEGNKSADTGDLFKISAVWNQGLRKRSMESEAQQKIWMKYDRWKWVMRHVTDI